MPKFWPILFLYLISGLWGKNFGQACRKLNILVNGSKLKEKRKTNCEEFEKSNLSRNRITVKKTKWALSSESPNHALSRYSCAFDTQLTRAIAYYVMYFYNVFCINLELVE